MESKNKVSIVFHSQKFLLNIPEIPVRSFEDNLTLCNDVPIIICIAFRVLVQFSSWHIYVHACVVYILYTDNLQN